MHHQPAPRRVLTALSLSLALLGLAAIGHGQATGILSQQKIGNVEGGLTGPLHEGDMFGIATAYLGDLDGDGVGDLAVGAAGDDDGGPSRGAVWILFLNPDRTVKTAQKISQASGNLGQPLADYDRFGVSITCLGDHDGDGVVDIAVGAWTDDDGGTSWLSDRGAVYILFLQTDGTVRDSRKISATSGGLVGPLGDGDYFGASVAAMGDLDGDGVGELAVGARGADVGGIDRGAVYVLYLRPDGTVWGERLIGMGLAGFGGPLDRGDDFGNAVANLGDVNGDGYADLAVGAWRDDAAEPWGSAPDYGAVWILFLDQYSNVIGGQYVTLGYGSFAGVLDPGDQFGSALAAVGDLDGDGVGDLAVGASFDDDGGGVGSDAGAMWFLFLRSDGSVRSHLKMSATAGGVGGGLGVDARFGSSVASLGDFDNDGAPDVAIGSGGDDDGGANADADFGAIYTMLLRGCPTAAATSRNPDLGAGANPEVYTAAAPPLLGSTFSASVVTTGKAGCVFLGYASPASFATPWGNALINTADPGGELLGGVFATGDPAVFQAPIPDDPAFCGLFAATQGLRFGGGVDLTNALDLLLGR